MTGPQAVYVKWLDSCEPADNSDVMEDEFPEPQIIESYGVLGKVEPDHIVLCGAVKKDSHVGRSYDYVITIPRVSIIRMNAITVGEPVK